MVSIVTMEIIRGYLEYTAEEMGMALRNSAFSPNIKERMDHSCAIFDWNGRLIAQAEHIPVHLGAMPLSVRVALEEFGKIEEGDMIALNDPYNGGTHLPDITIIAPVYHNGDLIAYIVNRAHHSDVGGKAPGSMPSDSIEIFEEGLIIPPVKIVKEGEINSEVLKIILSNTRTPRIRRGDLVAQLTANKTGIKRVKELVEKYGKETFKGAVKLLLDYTERRVKAKVKEIPDGEAEAIDYLDDTGHLDESIPIKVRIIKRNTEVVFDFRDNMREIRGALNSPRSVTVSASYYVFKAITDPTIPSNDGAYRALKVLTRKGTILDATPPYAVAAGNVETSQRIVDVLLKALSNLIPKKIPAASQGTMNNVTIGGINPKTGKQFTFYETIGGGGGACYGKHGESAVHTHMTNTMNTPIEEIEKDYPIMITKYTIREDSGGNGKWRGGDGVIREYLFLTDTIVNLLGERHKHAPWGLQGGKPGAKGEYYKITKHGEKIKLKSKARIEFKKGERLLILTPGGGGYGKQEA